MKTLRTTLVRAALALATLSAAQGCIPVIVGGTGMAVAMVSDRRSSGTYVEDEGIEWKANKWISDRLGDKVHLNATSFNRKLLLTGEAFNEASRDEAGRVAASVENVREVVNELRVAPTSTFSARSNDSYISSKVKARFVDQKDFHIQHVKVVTEAGTVYLLGLVSEREGIAATEIARTTSGVQKVVRVFEYVSDEEARRLDSATSTESSN
jgi:osmotically-inducible protein OsmY